MFYIKIYVLASLFYIDNLYTIQSSAMINSFIIIIFAIICFIQPMEVTWNFYQFWNQNIIFVPTLQE